MKHTIVFRQLLVILTLISGLFIIEKIRAENKKAENKTGKKAGCEGSNFNMSNTDFIFFESLSKYLFVALEK
jgi:hypothetical protein